MIDRLLIEPGKRYFPNLPLRSELILRMRFRGLSRRQIGLILSWSRKRVGQVERAALEMLAHPSRIDSLQTFLEQRGLSSKENPYDPLRFPFPHKQRKKEAEE